MTIRHILRASAYALSLLAASTLVAQETVDLSKFEYRYVGPTRGGRVTAVEGIASQPSTFYMGATGGGVWKTEDYGTTWQNVSDGYFETPSIGAIAVAQNDPNIVYVGTGSDGLRSNVIAGKGVYKSIDAGKSWKHIGLRDAGQIGAVELHPTDHNVAYVAAIGQPFQKNKERGLYRTKDGGVTWDQVLYISDKTGIVDLEMMPTNPNIIYAASWLAERKPWTIISGGDENGIYKSIDGGDTWQRASNGLPELMGKIDLAVCPADSRLVYALVEAPGDQGGLYISEDQGESYRLVSNYYPLMDRPFYYTNLEVDPTNPDIIHAPVQTYYKSTDRGKKWKRVNVPHGDSHDIWINPHNTDLQINANDGGANVTHNGGKSWSTQLNQPTAELYQVEVDNQYPYWLYAGQQDNYTTVSVPSRPPHSHQLGGLGYIMDTGGCETGPAVPNPENHNIVYANCKGKFSVYNKATGQEQRYDVGAAYMYGHNPRDLKYRFQRVSPIHVSPHDSRVIYHTSQFVHKTMDEGKTWDIISPDLTAFEADKQVRSGSPISNDITGEEFYSTIYSIRESPITPGLIYVGANDGPIHVTRDGGQNWTNVTPKGLPKGGRVDCVEPSPHSVSKAYVTVLRYQLGDWTPYIYRTNDYGKSWKLINNGIPADYPVRVVREDPDREGLLYAGTEYGMYISFDDGENWQSFQQNLPITPITDIKVHRGDLVLSTMGRGFQILDNLTPLHQEYDRMSREKAHLFAPKMTVRYRHGAGRGERGRQGPKYPRPAAIIDYYLPKNMDSGISLHIIDKSGRTIRSYVSDTIAKTVSVTRNMSTNEFTYTLDDQLKTTAGLHRFKWDLKHHGAWHTKKSRRYSGGPYAAPGKYTVRIDIGDVSLSQPLELITDPRVTASGVTARDIAQQEALALQVVDLLSKARKKADEVEKELKALPSDSKEEKERLTVLKDKLVRKKGRYTETRFINQVEYLMWIVTGADQLPGRDAYDRLEELKAEFDILSKE